MGRIGQIAPYGVVRFVLKSVGCGMFQWHVSMERRFILTSCPDSPSPSPPAAPPIPSIPLSLLFLLSPFQGTALVGQKDGHDGRVVVAALQATVRVVRHEPQQRSEFGRGAEGGAGGAWVPAPVLGVYQADRACL